MIIIPAIDLKKSKVVRLYKGKFEETTSYEGKPEVIVRDFIARGARRIHIVSLLGARDGRILDEDMNVIESLVRMRSIFGTGKCLLQLGGGIRRMDEINRFFEIGIDLLIVSTSLVLPLVMECGYSMSDIKAFYRRSNREFNLEETLPEIDLMNRMNARIKERIIVGVDVAGAETALSGWMVTVPLQPSYVIGKMAENGFRRFMLTDVSRDGTLTGIDVERFNDILAQVGKPVKSLEIIIAGGIGGAQDLERIRESGIPVTGVVIGKALYERKMELSELIKEFQTN